MNSLRGQLLVASPHLPDPNFYRTVVLMVEHHDQGALGLILNRTSSYPLRKLWEKVSDVPCLSNQKISLGGPVEGPLMAIHTQPECSEGEVIAGLYFATQRENLEQIVAQDEHPFRIFSGYSGWGAGQLDQEMEVGGWLVTPAARDYVFSSTDEELWQKVAAAIGREITQSALKLRHLPDDPSVN